MTNPSDEVEKWTVKTDEQGYQKIVCNDEDVTDEIGHPGKTDLQPICDAHNATLAALQRKSAAGRPAKKIQYWALSLPEHPKWQWLRQEMLDFAAALESQP